LKDHDALNLDFDLPLPPKFQPFQSAGISVKRDSLSYVLRSAPSVATDESLFIGVHPWLKENVPSRRPALPFCQTARRFFGGILRSFALTEAANF
jgi:hypothetical protein